MRTPDKGELITYIRRQKSPSYSFSFLISIVFLLLLAGSNIEGGRLPAHDSFYEYQYFNVFYSHYFFYGSILQWLPYGNLGLPSIAFDFLSIAPSFYMAGFIGKLLGIKDALLLFNLGIYTNFFLYVLGLQFLLKELRIHHGICLVALVTSLATLNWQWQPYWGINFVYLAPLMLWSLVKFEQTLETKWFYFFGFFFIINLIGNMPYQAILQFYIFALFFLVLFFSNQELRRLFFSMKMIRTVYLPLLVICALPVLILCHDILTNFINVAPSRSANFQAEKAVFLTYGFQSPLLIFYSFITGAVVMADNSCYLGLAAILFFFLGLFLPAGRYFKACLFTTSFLVLLSFGGLFSRLVYLFPAMKFYRHIGLVYQFADVFILVGAAISAQNFLMKAQKNDSHSRILRLKKPEISKPMKIFISFFFADLFFGIFSRLYFFHLGFGTIPKELIGFHANLPTVLFFVRVVFYSLLFFTFFSVRFSNKSRLKLFANLFIFVALFDVLSFSFFSHAFVQKHFQKANVASRNIEPLIYQTSRNIKYKATTEANQERWDAQNKNLLVVDSLGDHSASYAQTGYLFSSFDPCFTNWRIDLLSPSVASLYESIAKNPMDASLLNEIACERSKLVIENPKLNGIKVFDFKGDSLGLEVFNHQSKPINLQYADAQYLGWQALIDQQSYEVQETPSGFKKISVPSGHHQIVFFFKNKVYTVISYYLFFLSFAFFLFFFYLCFYQSKSSQIKH